MMHPTTFRNLKNRMLEESLAQRRVEDKELYAIKFDGATKPTNTGQRRIKKVHHLTIIKEPGSRYVTHFTPIGDDGVLQGIGVNEVIRDTNSVASLRAIGCGKYFFQS